MTLVGISYLFAFVARSLTKTGVDCERNSNTKYHLRPPMATLSFLSIACAYYHVCMINKFYEYEVFSV